MTKVTLIRKTLPKHYKRSSVIGVGLLSSAEHGGRTFDLLLSAGYEIRLTKITDTTSDIPDRLQSAYTDTVLKVLAARLYKGAVHDSGT